MADFEDAVEDEAVEDEAVEEAISQVKEVVDMAQENGPHQPRLREMAAEFFLGVSGSEKGRRALQVLDLNVNYFQTTTLHVHFRSMARL